MAFQGWRLLNALTTFPTSTHIDTHKELASMDLVRLSQSHSHLSEGLDGLSVNDQPLLGLLNRALVAAVNRVVLCVVCGGLFGGAEDNSKSCLVGRGA